MLISSRDTPKEVAPPLSFAGSQYGTHGGDCGSSVCRGGLPTQRLMLFRSGPPLSPPGPAGCVTAVVVVVGDSPEPPTPLPPASPDPEFDACSFGASLICSTACGAISAMAGRADCGAVSSMAVKT